MLHNLPGRRLFGTSAIIKNGYRAQNRSTEQCISSVWAYPPYAQRASRGVVDSGDLRGTHLCGKSSLGGCMTCDSILDFSSVHIPAYHLAENL
jgi:hypothetical protein